MPLAEAVKNAHGDKILVGAVGVIQDGVLAESILEKVRRSCGVCFEGRTDGLLSYPGPGGRDLQRADVPEEPWYGVGYG